MRRARGSIAKPISVLIGSRLPDYTAAARTTAPRAAGTPRGDKNMNKMSAAAVQHLRSRLNAITNDLLRERSRPLPNPIALAALTRQKQEIETRLTQPEPAIAA
jgi:hypothetical protein